MILRKIIEDKKEEITHKKKSKPISELREINYKGKTHRHFSTSITQTPPTIIAEIKRHSPSRGPIWEDLNPAELAKRYEKSGASAISILTDLKYFHGSEEDLIKAKSAVSLPCLRKEFIIDEYQVYESATIGADAILLIVRILSPQQLKDYISLANELNLECLVEVHSEVELEIALTSGAKIIGVNNRDLDTLKVDVNTSLSLKKLIPENCIAISESGLNSPDVIRKLHDAGFSSFLIGESILLSRQPEKLIPLLLGKNNG